MYFTLQNAAQMKLTIDPEELEARVNEILILMGLERERDSLVSKLSGGQRKRLSIAVEFISKPSLFFLDEPDSGLDGVMARGLMVNLRQIADTGKIVMVISHGPDRASDLFDKVIILIIMHIANRSNYPLTGVLFPASMEFMITFFLIIFSSDVLGILISCIVKNENTAMTVMPFVLIIQLIMSGMIFLKNARLLLEIFCGYGQY